MKKLSIILAITILAIIFISPILFSLCRYLFSLISSLFLNYVNYVDYFIHDHQISEYIAVFSVAISLFILFVAFLALFLAFIDGADREAV